LLRTDNDHYDDDEGFSQHHMQVDDLALSYGSPRVDRTETRD